MCARSIRCFLIVLLTVFAVASVTIAFATPPEHSEDEYTITNSVLGSCDGFDIIENATVRVQETTFFDKAGTPVRVEVHSRYSGTLTNSVTGKTITDAPDAVNIVLLADGTAVLHGLLFSINVPGQGVVALDVGTLIFNPDGSVIVHGPHPLNGPEGEGLAILCAALE